MKKKINHILKIIQTFNIYFDAYCTNIHNGNFISIGQLLKMLNKLSILSLVSWMDSPPCSRSSFTFFVVGFIMLGFGMCRGIKIKIGCLEKTNFSTKDIIDNSLKM